MVEFCPKFMTLAFKSPRRKYLNSLPVSFTADFYLQLRAQLLGFLLRIHWCKPYVINLVLQLFGSDQNL